MSNQPKQPILKVNGLKKYFSLNSGIFTSNQQVVKAVDDVSFEIFKGETFGLVGESGCGKSSLGRTITQLYDATEGEVIFNGVDLTKLKPKELKPYRKSIQMIFQDPYSALNPYMNVEEIINEPIDIHLKVGKKEKRKLVIDLLKKVGLKEGDLKKFPHEFSGGQRQRIGIARALAINPDFILCDEAISALDVSIQAQVVNLLKDLQDELGLTYLFVAHDLSMVRYISDRIGVMYLGRIVEIAGSEELYKKPLHPYTKGLFSALLIPDPKQTVLDENENSIQGELPSPINIPNGCRFRSRCPYAMDVCAHKDPTLQEIETGHFVACHLYEIERDKANI